MACGGKDSVERIGEALIKKVIEEELKDIPLEDDPFLTLDAVEVKNEQEEERVKEVSALVRKVGDKLKDDKEIQDGIKRLARDFELGGTEEANKMLEAVFNETFKDGITWEKIVSFLYVVGKVVGIMAVLMAGSMVVMALCPSVKRILSWTVDFFKNYLLVWIREQGGWIRCLVQS
ncbi:apoptosis regulator BAX-like [Hippoglossus stenolepis]|uniref:apoptosis regulator BAX-like n=1 Tax=Hippoglossus stenolepis TaxID=195615 RepID=UPI001FB02540|nr:apoptosis regulator BAX-like [Hippoglossus stenolepis]